MIILVLKNGIKITLHLSQDEHHDDSSLEDEPKKLHVTELVWPTKAKISARSPCIRYKKGKLISHLMLLHVTKYLMSYLRMITLNCRTKFLR